MSHPTRARLLVAFTMLAFASLAQAQYVWINDKGVKEYSDRSPPASVPLKDILKAPNGQPTAASLPAAPAADAKPAPTLVEREADYQKRQKEKTELARTDKEAQNAQAMLALNCKLTRAAKTQLDSGVRIRTADANGSPTFMTEEQRAMESKKTDHVLAACK